MARLCDKFKCRNCLTLLLFYLSWILVAGNPDGFADFHFIAEPTDTVVVKGNPAILDCSATGDPPPSIRWKREGSDLVLSDDRRRILENGSLYFDKVYHTRTERPDEGLYQCSATRPGLGTVISRPAKLQIASLPKFDMHPADLTLFPEQTAYFPCSVHAIPPATIKWLKDEQPLQLDSSRMTVLPSGALEIDLVEKMDAASYRCNASNVEKFRLSDTGILIVNFNFDASNLITSPYFVATPPKTSIVVEGNQLTLDCVANGNPKPKITWLKDGTTIDMADLDSRFRIVGSGSLHIEKAQEEDAGTYMCRAENNEDSVDSLANVVVHVSPRFIKKPQNKYAFEKEDIEFECEVYGKPLPTIQWYRDGQHLIQSEYYQYIKGSNLRILGVVKSDAGIYQCIAFNPSGNLQASLQLIIYDSVSTSLTTTYSYATTARFHETIGPFNSKDAPSAPQNLSAIIVETRFVTLKWSSPVRTNGDIFAYSVYYREMSSPRERVLNTTRVRLEEVNIQGLQPATTYVFRVVAYNQHGPGESSANLTVITRSEAKVPSLPVKLEAIPVSPTSVLVQWRPPGEGSEPIHQYVVYYTEDGVMEQKVSTANHKQLLTDLKKFTEYTVWVTATNHLGVGQHTKEITVKTYSDVPSDTPQNVTLEPASSNSIIVRWEPPPKESQNGVITGYKIRYRAVSNRAETVTTDGNRRLYALTGLERGVQYSVKIAALSVNGSGPFTEWMTAETYQNDLNESQVPGQPSSIRARPAATAIHVSWVPPRNVNIMIRGYTIGWGIGYPDVYTQVLDGKQRHYTIDNLNPSSEYVISLRAFNQIGDGRPVYDTVKTLVETTPEPLSAMMPPVGLKAIVLSATTVVLYWTDTSLSHNQIVTDNRYYIVRYSTTNKYKYFNSTELNCMIDDLKPNTQYEFSVKVVKGRRESTWSMSVFNTTQEAVPSSPPRDLTIVPSEDDSSQINLHWQPPKQPNGHITGYVISYSVVAPQRNLAVEDRKWVLEESIGDKMATVLKGLSLDTVYYFKIQAKNSKGYGPFSSEINFRTSAESKSLSNSMLYVIIACVSGGALILLIIVIIVVCRKRQRYLQNKRTKSYMKSTLAKNKTLGKELVPPDLWIHHDQMELKPVDKNTCAENNMTVTPIQRNSQELGEEPLLSCIEKKKSAYLEPNEDNNSVTDKCIVKCHIRATPIKIPLDVQKPLLNHTSVVPLPSSSQMGDAGGSMGRPMYPRTQYNIPRTHNSGEICHAGSAADAIVPMPVNLHTVVHGAPYEPVISNIAVEKCQGYPTTSAVPPAIEQNSGTLTKRLPGHPLRSFSVPAPPPQSAPATPQPKHLDTCLPKPTAQHSCTQPSSSTPQPQSAAQPSAKAQAEGGSTNKATSGAPVHVSWSTEKLNQEVANLEGLMKDLNAIRASEFEC